MPLKIIRNDITKMNTEAIVNTANSHVTVGPGCDWAVYTAAGFEELLAYRKEKIGKARKGEAFITPGFNLPAQYIIHAVSPPYAGGNEREQKLLRSCYRKSLQLAEENGIKSIAFPLISTGSFGYPKEEGMRIAVDEINAFLLNHDMLIYLVVFDDKAKSLGKRIYPDLEEYIDQNYVDAKHVEEYTLGAPQASNARPELNAVRPEHGAARPEHETARPEFPYGDEFDYEDELAAPELISEAPAADVPAAPDLVTGSLAAPSYAAPPSAAEAGAAPAYEHAYAEPEIDEEDLKEKLAERMKHISDTFSEYLLYLIKEKNLKNADVYNGSIVSKKVFSKIKNNKDYHPTKFTAMRLCIGAHLNLDETRDLLSRAGYALSPSDKTDIIFSYFIENEIFDIIEIDIQLEEHGLPCVIS